MSERQRSYSAPGSDFQWRWEWVSYTPSIAVCWEHCTKPDGEQTKQMVGFHIYGEVNSSNLRSGVPLRLIDGADPADYPSWPIEPWNNPDDPWNAEVQDDPRNPQPQYISPQEVTRWMPTGRQVDEAWMEAGAITFDRDAPPPMSSRGKDEPINDFYARVARSYQYLASTTGKPTTAIAMQAKVKRETAARWVHEARKRDLLPKTTAGKVTR